MEYTFDSNLVSDLHKDALGFRPRRDFMDRWNQASDSVRQLIWNGMLIALDRALDEEAEAEQRAIEAFENGIEQQLANGACDRDDAVKSLILNAMSESELCYGGDYVCYKLGLPYYLSPEMDLVVAKMQQTA